MDESDANADKKMVVQGQPAVRRASASSGSNEAKKSRTPMSCDRCKNRKTKCLDPVPGPCQHCANNGLQCVLPQTRKKRPYYHVTEDEYRCSMRILQHLLPSCDTSDPEALKEVAQELNLEKTDFESSTPNTKIVRKKGSSVDARGDAEGTQEIGEDLHGQLGCLMEDSLGEFRYVGAYSEIAFNAAVCTMKSVPSPEKLIEPTKFALPPQKPRKSPPHGYTSRNPYLPPREYAFYYVTRFFEDVNSVYWFYAAEEFHTRLEETYEQPNNTSSSWLCSLYAIFSLGSATGSNTRTDLFHDCVPVHAREHPDPKISQDYIDLAKQMVPHLHDEADIDSVRGLAILGLALNTFGFRITSYLYMGTSIRIAFSLGLQHDKSPPSHGPTTKQRNRRIWWTLYMLDEAVASRCGSPYAIDEGSLSIQASLPLEQIMNPGTNTPLGILSVSTALSRLKREIISTIYPEKSSRSTPISFSRVMNVISSLQTWLAEIPSHLKWGVAVAPSHKRAIAILHLNYWVAVMLATQPFLLYLVLRGENLAPPKRASFEDLANICIDAAKSALEVLRKMSNELTLSSLTTLDSSSVLKVVMVFILALAKTNSPQYRQDINTCLELLQKMEQVGFAAIAAQELPIRLSKLDIMKDDIPDLQKDLFASQLWPRYDNFTSSNNLQYIDTMFGPAYPADMVVFMDSNVDLSQLQGFHDNTGPGFDLGASCPNSNQR